MRLAFIGGGTMAEAILSGVLSAELSKPDDISVGEPVEGRCQYLTQKYGVSASPENLKATHGADLVVLAIKPQDLPVVFRQFKGKLAPNQAAFSIVAGAKIATLTEGLGHSAVIRVMPKTGRTHQIRVHMIHAGCPIFCDRLYSGRARVSLGDFSGQAADNETTLLERQALHAHKIKFAHPKTGESIECVAKLPVDLTRTRQRIREFRSLKS